MKTEIKVGLVGLGILVLLFFGVKFLKGSDLLSKENKYYAEYTDVSGMHESNYIYLNGMKVGYVKKIEPMSARADRFRVTIAVNSDIEVAKDSRVVLFSADVLGSKALKLELGQSSELLQDGGMIKGEVELGMLDKLGGSIAPMAQNLDSILAATKNILNYQSQANLKNTFANLESASERLNRLTASADELVAKEKGRISVMLSNLESITTNFKNNNEKINDIISRIDEISDTLAQAQIGTTLLKTSQTIERLSYVLTTIESGRGNLGLLVNDEGLYRNLEESARRLNALIEDIKANPKRYVKISVF